MKKGIYIGALICIIGIISACEPKPKPIHYGNEECTFCKMWISQTEFAAQVVNPQGKNYNFDSIECMTAYVLNTDKDKIHSQWVQDFNNRDNLLDAEAAVYLKSETLNSPMGLYLSAYADIASAKENQKEYGGEILDFSQVKKAVETEWLKKNNQNHPVNH